MAPGKRSADAIMALTLPHQFDTSGVVKLILRGVVGLLLIVFLGILYSLIVSHSIAATIQLLVVAAVATYFGTLFLRNLTGSLGTITADAIVVQPGELFGLRLASPAGRFPISQFQAVRVDRIRTPAIDVQGRPHERVCLVGKQGTPDILIARTDRDVGRTLGNELATVLRLPYQEQAAPY